MQANLMENPKVTFMHYWTSFTLNSLVFTLLANNLNFNPKIKPKEIEQKEIILNYVLNKPNQEITLYKAPNISNKTTFNSEKPTENYVETKEKTLEAKIEESNIPEGLEKTTYLACPVAGVSIF